MEYKTFIVFWKDGSMTTFPNSVGSNREGNLLSLTSDTDNVMLINFDFVIRVEIIPQDHVEDPEEYK
ncbi:MAG TPA: hypothetical protein VMW08_11835 [Acidimicrobiales bacterium]|nr:hypothetical protein [Acidimicrobiales bacterium]